jgi:hypothetical protein
MVAPMSRWLVGRVGEGVDVSRFTIRRTPDAWWVSIIMRPTGDDMPLQNCDAMELLLPADEARQLAALIVEAVGESK